MTNFKTGGPWITRFAPSPTGVLHLGNARTAVLNFLLARQSGGKFLLRLEDTDQERSTFASEAAILWSLAWMGLAPDRPVEHQSLRLSRYRHAVRDLLDRDLAYPCFCSEEQLEQDRQTAAARGLPPRYSGRCLHLDPSERSRRLAEGESHVVRLRGETSTDICFTDLIKGEMTIPATAFGDFVLLRSNGWPSYNLAVVVDDAEMGVNLVLRGEDHLTNTARQILLYRALDRTPPSFAHHGLLVDPEGKKLSKRTGALSIPECMAMGLQPLAVVQYLASLSGALPTKTLFNELDAMARAFNPFSLGRGNAVLNLDELQAVSGRFFRESDPAMLTEALDQTLPTQDRWHGLDPTTRRELVVSLRENASCLHDLQNLLPHFTAESVSFSPSALAELKSGIPVLQVLDQILSTFPASERLDKGQAQTVLKETGVRAGVKGRHLYHPVRLALTGGDSGPELTALLTLLPTESIGRRVRAVLEFFSHCNHKD